MIKAASPDSWADYVEVNKRRLDYFNFLKLAPIEINENVVAIYDDKGHGFFLGELGHFKDGKPVWMIQCFDCPTLQVQAFLRAAAETAEKMGHIDTAIMWIPQKNILREVATNSLLQPSEKYVGEKRHWTTTVRSTLEKV